MREILPVRVWELELSERDAGTTVAITCKVGNKVNTVQFGRPQTYGNQQENWGNETCTVSPNCRQWGKNNNLQIPRKISNLNGLS